MIVFTLFYCNEVDGIYNIYGIFTSMDELLKCWEIIKEGVVQNYLKRFKWDSEMLERMTPKLRKYDSKYENVGYYYDEVEVNKLLRSN